MGAVRLLGGGGRVFSRDLSCTHIRAVQHVRGVRGQQCPISHNPFSDPNSRGPV